MPLINADGCPVHVEVAGPERAPVPPVIIGRDDRGRDEPASETIGRHFPCRDAACVEISCDGTARCAASLDAALDVGGLGTDNRDPFLHSRGDELRSASRSGGPVAPRRLRRARRRRDCPSHLCGAGCAGGAGRGASGHNGHIRRAGTGMSRRAQPTRDGSPRHCKCGVELTPGNCEHDSFLCRTDPMILGSNNILAMRWT